MVNLFEFTDYREYLLRYYIEKKKANPRYSYQLLTRQAGFSNRGFIHNVIKGTRNLSKLNCYKLSQALGHSAKEQDYFENIVAYAQTDNEKERSYFLKQAFQVADKADVRLIEKDRYEYYSTWYHSAIRSLIDMLPVRNNYAQLSRRLSPSITASQVKESLKLLKRLGLIAKGSDGCYQLTGRHIRTSNEISRAAKNQFHIACAELAKNSIRNDPPDSRNAVSMTLGLSRKMYKDIVRETQSFITSIVNIVENNRDAPERVYQYELLLFPLSNVAGRKQAP
jgi:uncharacterized protein (TIGR02147 family)